MSEVPIFKFQKILSLFGGLPFSITHLGGGGLKSPIHFHCVLRAKSGEGVHIA